MATDILIRTSDDDALRLKVEEAMNVYDEYVKNQGPSDGPSDGQAQPNGAENMNPAAEEVKDVEA